MADPTLSPWAPAGWPANPSPALASPGLYLRTDDNVRLTSYNSAAGVVLACRARMLAFDGSVQEQNDPQTPNTDRTAKATIFPTGDGWLLGGEVFPTSGTPLDGQCFVVVEIVRGTGTAALALQTLAAGYVTAKQPLPFPAASLLRALDGQGAIRSITGATPGAGAEISETVPTGARWELLAFTATLTTSVTVINRVAALRLDDGANVFTQTQAATNAQASSLTPYVWMPGTNQFTGNNGVVHLPLAAGVSLGPGFRLRTLTQNLQAGDQWSLVQYLVRERIEGA